MKIAIALLHIGVFERLMRGVYSARQSTSDIMSYPLEKQRWSTFP